MIDEDVRKIVELTIELILEHTNKAVESAQFVLEQQRIEPNLEAVFSYYMGYMEGSATATFIIKHKRQASHNEIVESRRLFNRRANELREALASTLFG